MLIIKSIFENQYNRWFVIMRIKTKSIFHSPLPSYCFACTQALTGSVSVANKTSMPPAELFLIFKDNWKHTEKLPNFDLKFVYLEICNAFIRECPSSLRGF